MAIEYTLTYFDPHKKAYERIEELTNEQANILVAEYKAMGFDAEIELNKH